MNGDRCPAEAVVCYGPSIVYLHCNLHPDAHGTAVHWDGEHLLWWARGADDGEADRIGEAFAEAAAEYER